MNANEHQGPRDRVALAERVAAQFALEPAVRAVALAGSVAAGAADERSDCDLYVYSPAAIPVATRRAIAQRFAARAEIDNHFWEPGDEWIDSASGLGVDVMYRDPDWITDQVARSLTRHEASVGYSTCFWHNVRHSHVLYDPAGWYTALRDRAVAAPYPAALRQAIIAKNHPLLRATISSYAHQIASAVARHDVVSQCHRVTALLASYFDILFAVNGVPHPGEKRQLALARRLCPLQPDAMTDDVERVVWALGAMDDRSLLVALQALLHRLDVVLLAEGLIAPADL